MLEIGHESFIGKGEITGLYDGYEGGMEVNIGCIDLYGGNDLCQE